LVAEWDDGFEKIGESLGLGEGADEQEFEGFAVLGSRFAVQSWRGSHRFWAAVGNDVNLGFEGRGEFQGFSDEVAGDDDEVGELEFLIPLDGGGRKRLGGGQSR
jgi:hypothetical protein